MKKYNIFTNDIYLEKIESKKPGRGYGNDLLKELLYYADSRHKTILLKADAEKRLSQKQLVSWYERNGFIIMDEDCYTAFGQTYMYRPPYIN